MIQLHHTDPTASALRVLTAQRKYIDNIGPDIEVMDDPAWDRLIADTVPDADRSDQVERAKELAAEERERDRRLWDDGDDDLIENDSNGNG